MFIGWSDYVIHIRAEKALALPEFPGSMLRGAFGHALKRVACAMKLRNCDGCPLEHGCLYTTIFETRPPTGGKVMTRYNRAPHPFVFVVDLHRDPNIPSDALCFGFRLFGSAISAAPFCLRALQEAAEGGLTRTRIPFQMDSIRQNGTTQDWLAEGPWPEPCRQPPPHPWPAIARVQLKTPLRLTVGEKLMSSKNFSAPAFCAAVLRRFGLLSHFFGDGAAPLDFSALKQEAMAVRAENIDLQWMKLYRHSNRQKARQSIGGILGEVTLDLSQAPNLRALMGWAPVLHVGKGTSMGLGRVELIT